MKLRVVSVGALNDFVKEPAFATLADLPIVPIRALSQANNPHADDDDPALIIAYDDGQVLAFLGCLPDRLNASDSEKICWNSGWWAHPEKGNVAVMPVFYKGLQLWEGKMLFDALPERSKEILKRMGHFSFRSIDGVLGYGRSKFHKIIPERKPGLSIFKNIFYLLDQGLNIPIKMRISWWRKNNKLSSDIQVERLNEIDQKTAIFIKTHASKDLVDRNEKHLNWPIRFPWLSFDEVYRKWYYFSTHAARFENILLSVKEKNNIIGFVWLSYRDGTIKTPYCFVSKGKERIIAKVIYQELTKFPFEAFICYQTNILQALENISFPFSYKKKIKKDFGWSKLLDHHFTQEVYIQDGDGDGVFT